MKKNIVLIICFIIVFIGVVFATYGAVQLYERPNRINLENQVLELKNQILELKKSKTTEKNEDPQF